MYGFLPLKLSKKQKINKVKSIGYLMLLYELKRFKIKLFKVTGDIMKVTENKIGEVVGPRIGGDSSNSTETI